MRHFLDSNNKDDVRNKTTTIREKKSTIMATSKIEPRRGIVGTKVRHL